MKEDRRGKEPEWEMRRTGPARGGPIGCLERKVFLKNQKHEPNIVEITLCKGFTLVYIYRARDLEKLNCLYKFSNATSLSPARGINPFSYTHTHTLSHFLAPQDFAAADKCAATSWSVF
jgi:hypothetical protein